MVEFMIAPATQGLHDASPSPLNLPFGQFKQLDEFVSALIVLAAHCWHDDWPDAF